ncbi:MAG: thioesterase family protein [Peptostreptococcaceae bacterium]|nr:thioesterase family protein [Peptostreptococcaceae bacterium]
MLKIGIKGRQEITVCENNSAKTLGSGTLDVFATPAMIALMEKTAWMSVSEFLPEGDGTVGISLDIKHIAATPLGMKVYCESELVEIDERKLKFELKAYDEKGLIGEGMHERFIINNRKFQEKTDSKK